jgi:hypothetical protein
MQRNGAPALSGPLSVFALGPLFEATKEAID